MCLQPGTIKWHIVILLLTYPDVYKLHFTSVSMCVCWTSSPLPVSTVVTSPGCGVYRVSENVAQHASLLIFHHLSAYLADSMPSI